MVTCVLFFELSSCFGCFHMVAIYMLSLSFCFPMERRGINKWFGRGLDSTTAAFKGNNNNSSLQILQGIIKYWRGLARVIACVGIC